jgi:hypothetical protein
VRVMVGFGRSSLNANPRIGTATVYQRDNGLAESPAASWNGRSGLVAIGGRDTHIEASALGVDISEGSHGSAIR